MSRRRESNEVILHHPETGIVELVGVSEETWRWSRHDSPQGPERRRIRRPFAATIEKIPNLCGPVLRLTGDSGERQLRGRRRRSRR